MSKNKFDSMSFCECGDGSLTDIVAKKSMFKNKEEFLKWFLNDSDEYGMYLDSHYSENEGIPVYTVNDIEEKYVRYFPHFGEDSGMDIDSGYTFCDKGRGAFETYSISFQ